jgi:hypothetical protein
MKMLPIDYSVAPKSMHAELRKIEITAHTDKHEQMFVGKCKNPVFVIREALFSKENNSRVKLLEKGKRVLYKNRRTDTADAGFHVEQNGEIVAISMTEQAIKAVF